MASGQEVPSDLPLSMPEAVPSRSQVALGNAHVPKPCLGILIGGGAGSSGIGNRAKIVEREIIGAF